MAKTLATVALTALVIVEHDGVKYGPGQPAGTDFEVTEAQARALFDVNAAKLKEDDVAEAATTSPAASTAARK